MALGELMVTYPAYINAFVLCDSQLVDEDTILIENVDAALKIEWDIDILRHTQMAQRVIGIKDYFEFRNVVRNTAAAGANDVLT